MKSYVRAPYTVFCSLQRPTGDGLWLLATGVLLVAHSSRCHFCFTLTLRPAIFDCNAHAFRHYRTTLGSSRPSTDWPDPYRPFHTFFSLVLSISPRIYLLRYVFHSFPVFPRFTIATLYYVFSFEKSQAVAIDLKKGRKKWELQQKHQWQKRLLLLLFEKRNSSLPKHFPYIYESGAFQTNVSCSSDLLLASFRIARFSTGKHAGPTNRFPIPMRSTLHYP